MIIYLLFPLLKLSPASQIEGHLCDTLVTKSDHAFQYGFLFLFAAPFYLGNPYVVESVVLESGNLWYRSLKELI